jgi:hypothetical protein
MVFPSSVIAAIFILDSFFLQKAVILNFLRHIRESKQGYGTRFLFSLPLWICDDSRYPGRFHLMKVGDSFHNSPRFVDEKSLIKPRQSRV